MSSILPHIRPDATAGATLPDSLDVRLGLSLLVAGQLLLLILFPLLGHHSPPLDAIEMHTWAAAPQFVYYKHPPLPAWGVFLSEALFGRSGFALFLPAALSVALATIATWPLARRIVGPRRALAALFIQSTVLYYNLYAPDYNHNVAQMPFWALTIAAFYLAVTDGGKRWWCAFGAALGLTALAKYSAALLPLACLALLAWEPRARRHATPANLLWAAGAFALVFGPHFVALAAHDFAPIHYLQQRGGELAADASWSERFLSFAGGQLIANLVPLALLIALRLLPAPSPAVEAPCGRLDRRFLLMLGLGPLAATLAIGLTGIYLHPMWASSMFPLSGLLVVYFLGARADRLQGRRWFAAWALLILLIGGGYAVKNTAAWSGATKKFARAAYPGPELARLLDQTWRQNVPDRPLRAIVGTRWEAGVASFFSSYRTRVLIDADLAISPWIAPDEIAHCGAIVTWDPWNPAFDFPPILRARFPNARILPNLEVDPDRPGTYYRKVVGVAVIPPSAGSPASACPAR